MKCRLRLVVVSVLTGFGMEVAHGKDCQGISFPEQAQIDGSTLKLDGLGLRQATFLKVNIYVAALYVAHVSSDPHTLLGSHIPKELILHNMSDDELKKAWEEGFEHNAKEQLPALRERVEMLKGWMVDIKSGQRLTFIHTPGAGIQVDVNGTVQGTIPGDDFATAFLDGYNNTFEDGALVIAELWHFLGRQGVPILYTWPAGAGSGLRGYTHDRESGEFTIFHLKQFLRVLASTVEVEEINLIAHSRGTDVLTSALRELYIETRADGHDFQTVYRIRNVVLAAADLDLEVITQRVAAEYMTLGVERATLYVSDVDRALGFAAFLFTSVHRLGQLRPEDLTDEERQHLARVARTQIIDFLADYSRLSRPPRHAGPLSDGRTGNTLCDAWANSVGWGRGRAGGPAEPTQDTANPGRTGPSSPP